MDYEQPEIVVTGESGVDTYGSWFSVETVLAAIAVAIMNVAVTAIDITP